MGVLVWGVNWFEETCRVIDARSPARKILLLVPSSAPCPLFPPLRFYNIILHRCQTDLRGVRSAAPRKNVLRKFVKGRGSCHINFTALPPLSCSRFLPLSTCAVSYVYLSHAPNRAPIQFPGNIPKRWLYQAEVISPLLQLARLTLSSSSEFHKSGWKFPSLSRAVFPSPVWEVDLRDWFSTIAYEGGESCTTICANEERKRTKVPRKLSPEKKIIASDSWTRRVPWKFQHDARFTTLDAKAGENFWQVFTDGGT